MRLSVPCQFPDEMLHNLAVFSERAPSWAVWRMGGTQYFYKTTGECHGHQTRSSSPESQKACLNNSKNIKWEMLIFCPHLPSVYMPFKEK